MRLSIGAFCAALSIAVTASAQSCGGIYKIKGGDTLSGIADSQYKDARKWSAIFNVNREQIGDSPKKIRVGQRLNTTMHQRITDRVRRGRQHSRTQTRACAC